MALDLPGLPRRLIARLKAPRIATVDAFASFVDERSALIAQKCAIDYCRGKTGLASYALFEEKPFLDALDVCRWETFAAVLEDLLLIAEGELRAHVPPERRAQLSAGLLRVHAAVLGSKAAPAHRSGGWHDAFERFAARLRTASDARPRSALDLADHSAKQLFDTLPIHISMRELDEEVVYGAVRFRMIAVSQEMRRRVDAGALAADLAA